MTKKTRLMILLICVTCFLALSPVLVLYSMGYRFDFEKMKATATGGIYIRTFPSAEQIIIDSKISQKPGMFSNSIFVQSLLPNNHSILVKKNGYYDYSKILPVQKERVTKLENVLLFKNNIGFETVADETKSPFGTQEKLLIKNNNLYYSNSPENSALTAAQKTTPVLKKLVAFALQNNDIIWLGSDGFLYKSDLGNLTAEPTKIALTPIKINKTGSYKIIGPGGYPDKNIFVNNNGSLLFLNTKTNELDDFFAPVNPVRNGPPTGSSGVISNGVKDAKISPDGKNIIYYNGKDLYISLISDEPNVKTALYKSPEEITDCAWLNDDYIIISSANRVVISEIDYRGNVNTITLPQVITLADKKIDIKKPQIFFNRQEGKLYILTADTLLSSEKITP